jgi:hypothetical protein
MESVIFVPLVSLKLQKVKKTDNSTFVRLRDYYLNVPLWGHSFQI